MKDIILNVLQEFYRWIYKISNKKKARVIPILAFHWFVSSEEKKDNPVYSSNTWYASIDEFENQIKWLYSQGYEFISCRQLDEWMNRKVELPSKAILLTFDDGEISQLKDVPVVLKKYGAKATVFVVGKYWMGETCKIPNGCREDNITHFTKSEYYGSKNKDYIDIQSHTYNLHYKMNSKRAIDLICDQELHSDLERMKSNGFEYIAMPYGAYSKNTDKILAKFYKLGFSFPGRKSFPYASRYSNKYKIPRIRIEGTKSVLDIKRYL